MLFLTATTTNRLKTMLIRCTATAQVNITVRALGDRTSKSARGTQVVEDLHEVRDEVVVLQCSDPLFRDDGLVSAGGTGERDRLLRDVAGQAQLTERVQAGQHLKRQI